MSARGQPTSVKSFPQHSLPPSHSQAPIIITAGRPIVILPNDYTLPINCSGEFLPRTSSSTFCLQPQSLANFHDSTPAPIITPIDDDSPNMEHMVPARPFYGVKAIEFPDNSQEQQCIVPGHPKVDICNKEKLILTAGKQAALDTSYLNVSKPQELNATPRSPPIIDFDLTSLLKLNPMPNDEPAPLQNPSSNSPLLLGLESGDKTMCVSRSRSQSHDQLQLPAQKTSSVGVSPLIMGCYEESKEQLVLDDSDSELEMPECSKSASCTPQHSGTDVQIRDSITLAPIEESVAGGESELNSYEPPPKRAKVMETDSNSPAPDECEYTGEYTPVGSGKDQDLDTHSPAVKQESCTTVDESGKNIGQIVPNDSLLFPEPLEAVEPTNASSSIVPDHTLKLECPHEPVDMASDGKDTADQMLPIESARQHAMVPNFVRCADDNQMNDDRDRPNDGGNGGTQLEAYVPAINLDPSHLESLEDVQAKMVDDLVPGQTVVELETADVHVPEIHEHTPHDPANSADTDISAKSQTDTCSPSLAVPTIMKPAPLSTEHQIVPEEFISTPSSSQSLYADHEFHKKSKANLQDESSVDRLQYSRQVLAVSLDSIEKRWSVAGSLSHSKDQALPESPSQLSQHYTDSGNSAGSNRLDSDEQRDDGEQSFGPFGFRLGKRTKYSQSKLL